MSMGPEKKENELCRKMRRLKIYEKDIEETFVRSSGPGGQNVNKVATCVQIYHVPSKIMIKCQSERTQALNRHKARQLLVGRIEAVQEDERRRAVADREKKRRQKRKRSAKSKEKMLEEKKHRSEKKKFRQKINTRSLD